MWHWPVLPVPDSTFRLMQHFGAAVLRDAAKSAEDLVEVLTCLVLNGNKKVSTLPAMLSIGPA